MFVKELGKKAGVPSVYTLPFYVLGQWKIKKIKVDLSEGFWGLWQLRLNSNADGYNPSTLL